MSVEQHRQQADAHAAKARRHRGKYDPATRIERSSGDLTETGRWKRDYDYRDEEEYSWGGSSYNPSARHLADARRHEALAQEHLDSARFLERFEEAECGAFPPEIRTQCPLLGQLVSNKEIPGGIRIRLAEGVDVDAALAHMRCHVAFARSIGHSGMNECPLYIEGIRMTRVGSTREIDFLVEGGTRPDALRELMKEHLSTGTTGTESNGPR